MFYDVWHGIEWLTEFAQNELTTVILLDPHVHKTFGAPAIQQKIINLVC